MTLYDGSELTRERINELWQKIKVYDENREHSIADPFYTADLAVITEAVRLLQHRLDIQSTKEEWLSSFSDDIKYGKADKEVLIFIANILFKNGKFSEEVRDLFGSGYCYYFAVMLKTAFKRGRIMVAAPYSHIVWEDDDGCTYDTDGICREWDYLVPVEELIGLGGFNHLPSSGALTSQEEFDKLRAKYSQPTFGYGINILKAAAAAPVKVSTYDESVDTKVRSILDMLWNNNWMRVDSHRFPIGMVKEISICGPFACGKSDTAAINIFILYDSSRYTKEKEERAVSAIEYVREKLMEQCSKDLIVTMAVSGDDDDDRLKFDYNYSMYLEWHEVLYPPKIED